MISLICCILKNATNELIYKTQNRVTDIKNKLKVAAAAAASLQSCPTLCDPIDSSPPGSPVSGILQARTLEWVAFSSPMQERKSESEVAQSCLTLSDPMDCSPPGSSMGFSR